MLLRLSLVGNQQVIGSHARSLSCHWSPSVTWTNNECWLTQKHLSYDIHTYQSSLSFRLSAQNCCIVMTWVTQRDTLILRTSLSDSDFALRLLGFPLRFFWPKISKIGVKLDPCLWGVFSGLLPITMGNPRQSKSCSVCFLPDRCVE